MVGADRGVRRGWSVDEQVVVERRNVEEDRLVVEEEFGEEGKVLCEELREDLSKVRRRLRGEGSRGLALCSSPSTS